MVSSNYDNIEDFTVDFTLSKDEEYGTRLDVEEKFTMIFPETNSQHGPVRYLFYTNQKGKNLISETGGKLDLQVLMDGSTFPIADTTSGVKGEDKYNIYYLGRASSYLHGEHTFTLKYHYVNVMLDSSSLQELYLNANGTGWDQTFSKLTANLHIADPEALAAVMSSQTSCYVGKYGAQNTNGNISSRCEVTELVDGVRFETEDLAYGEGLTFAVDFQPNTYATLEPKNDYAPLLIGGGTCLAYLVVAVLMIRSCIKKVGGKRKIYKDTFIKPEYEPTRGLTVAEGENLLMKKAKKSYVATLLELAVTKKVQIIKGEPTKVLKKDTWKVKVLSTDLTEPQTDMLKLLAGKHSVSAGEEIEIKKRTATAYMASVARSYSSSAVRMLNIKGLTEKTSRTISGVGVVVLISFCLLVTIGAWAAELPIGLIMVYTESHFGTMVGLPIILTILPVVFVAIWAIGTICSILKNKYAFYTKEGLRAERELEGLKLYIKMAEADRLKFLQSVKGADASTEGIVKIYEKTLPWAVLFGQEESWLRELGKYYQTIGDPEWCSDVSMLDVAMFHAMTTSITSSVASISSYSSGSSGSGGGSSGSFGGGGGGFSGGGSGGGGGGRW